MRNRRWKGLILVQEVVANKIIVVYSLTALQGVVAGEDLFVFTAPMGDADKSITYYVFDTRTATVYQHAYPLLVYPYIKRLEINRVVFLSPPNGERYETYKQHFSVLKP